MTERITESRQTIRKSGGVEMEREVMERRGAGTRVRRTRRAGLTRDDEITGDRMGTLGFARVSF